MHLKDAVLEGLPAFLSFLCFRAASHGLPDTSFLKKLRAAHPMSGVCNGLLAFRTPPRIFLDCFSCISSDVPRGMNVSLNKYANSTMKRCHKVLATIYKHQTHLNSVYSVFFFFLNLGLNYSLLCVVSKFKTHRTCSI